MAGVEYQVTKVDPTSTETKGMVYQVHSISADAAASTPGKVYNAKIVADPTDDEVKGKVFQITLVDDPTATDIKGKVFNAVISGLEEDVVVGPDNSPLSLPGAKAESLKYVKLYGDCKQAGPTPDSPQYVRCNNGVLYWSSNDDAILANDSIEKVKDSLNNEASAEMLLGIAGYKDEQDLISGDIIRRIGAVILDGTEDWSLTTVGGHTCFICPFVTSSAFNHMFCPYFKNDSPALSDNTFYRSSGDGNLVIRYDAMTEGVVESQAIKEFKDWLSEQIGTTLPVMIFYVLDAPQIEKVTGQTLQVKEGDNTLTIVQPSFISVKSKIEAKYTKVA